MNDTVQIDASSANASPGAGMAYEMADLAAGAIHCWHFDIDAASEDGDRLRRTLAKAERTHSARVGNPLSRTRFMTFRALLRVALGRYLAMDPAAVPIDQGPHGKPRLAGSDGYHGLVFNASHTAGQATLALAYDGYLGVDIQQWRRLTNVNALMRRCLAESERAYWDGLEEAHRQSALFRFWTLKEAYCKAVGRGLALGLNRCVFDCSGPEPRLIAQPDQGCDPLPWHFADMDLPAGISGAVALSRRIGALRHFTHRPGISV